MSPNLYHAKHLVLCAQKSFNFPLRAHLSPVAVKMHPTSRILYCILCVYKYNCIQRKLFPGSHSHLNVHVNGVK